MFFFTSNISVCIKVFNYLFTSVTIWALVTFADIQQVRRLLFHLICLILFHLLISEKIFFEYFFKIYSFVFFGHYWHDSSLSTFFLFCLLEKKNFLQGNRKSEIFQVSKSLCYFCLDKKWFNGAFPLFQTPTLKFVYM